ncbi:polyprotein [Senna tora]|uniref:Polyprotein n=1 Tax=Senna tora TaxID=362788 RepID=A0A834X0T5_9FABA|nr:polyprotein [Senna tora]
MEAAKELIGAGIGKELQDYRLDYFLAYLMEAAKELIRAGIGKELQEAVNHKHGLEADISSGDEGLLQSLQAFAYVLFYLDIDLVRVSGNDRSNSLRGRKRKPIIVTIGLRILGDGKRILQTDASDEYWGAILIEEDKDQLYYCEHASGQFKDSEEHYHTTYKEILAVKRCHFEVQMDNSSFPRMLEFKGKVIPKKQLHRWKD